MALLGLATSAAFIQAQNDPAGKKMDHIGGKSLDRWIAEILDQDPGVREKAIRTVALFGRDARKAVKKLITELNDTDPSLRVNAIMALGDIGMNEDDLEKGIKGLGRLLTTDPQAIVRFQAAVTLMKLGKDAKEAIPQLVTASRDQYSSWEVRHMAVTALGTVAVDRKEGPDPKAIRALITALRDHCARVRQQALGSLITLGKPEDSNLLQSEKSALLAVLRDKDKLLTLWARVALMRIDKIDTNYLFTIAQLLKDPDVVVRINAAQALGVVGPDAKSRVADVIEALHDKDPAVVTAVIAALVQMGEEVAPKAVPALENLVKGENEVLKLLAQGAIDSLTKKDKKPDAKKAP
jgi:HEAT repeat protein